MKIYMPSRFIDITASAPHDPSNSYRVSVGYENWGEGDMQWVYKVQMVRNGAVQGRRSPSFPPNTDDFDRVCAAMKELMKGKGEKVRGAIQSPGLERGLSHRDAKELVEGDI